MPEKYYVRNVENGNGEVSWSRRRRRGNGGRRDNRNSWSSGVEIEAVEQEKQCQMQHEENGNKSIILSWRE